MRARVSGATGTVDAAPLSTRETVLCETPTSSPICFMVRGRSARRRERLGRAAVGDTAARPRERAERTAGPVDMLQSYASIRIHGDDEHRQQRPPLGRPTPPP